MPMPKGLYRAVSSREKAILGLERSMGMNMWL
jgi:hypothetical protein